MMHYQVLFTLLAVALCEGAGVKSKSPPQFGDSYTVQGVLLLPYAEIKEPFTGYFDRQAGKSRVDYYGDLVKTYQRPDLGEYGVSYKIAYMPDKTGKPIRTCFQVNGTNDASVTTQQSLPDLSNFEFVQTEPCGPGRQGNDCERWEYTVKNGDKINKYTMWLALSNNDRVPYHYVMKGYNSLFGSHYDKYEVYYTKYSAGSIDPSVFDVEKGLECRNFPGPGVQYETFNNPIKEFIDNYDDSVHAAFEDFKNVHGKSYDNEIEHEQRQSIFRQNFRFIESTNRAAKTFTLAVNHLADRTVKEIRILLGRLPSTGYNGGKPFNKAKYTKAIPDQWDWRLYGAVTPVKDQAVCGSCWSFGTTGTLEGSYFLKSGKLVVLSEQQLIDCSWNYQNNGCDGGEDFRAYQYISETGGLSSTEEYGPYIGQDGYCHDRNVSKIVKIKDYVNVTEGDPTALKLALINHGPISVSIDASQKTFSFYANGVYYDENCGNTPDRLDHSVLAVGYGVINDEPYWLIKNSWSTYWGNDGYVLMSQKDNNCGVMTTPTFAVLK